MEANIGSEPLRRHMRFFVRMEEKCRNNGVRDFSEEKARTYYQIFLRERIFYLIFYVSTRT